MLAGWFLCCFISIIFKDLLYLNICKIADDTKRMRFRVGQNVKCIVNKKIVINYAKDDQREISLLDRVGKIRKITEGLHWGTDKSIHLEYEIVFDENVWELGHVTCKFNELTEGFLTFEEQLRYILK